MYIFYVLVVMLGGAQRRIYLGIYALFGLGNCFWRAMAGAVARLPAWVEYRKLRRDKGGNV
jgi:hypothetical protein